MFTSALKTFFGSGVGAAVTDAFFNLVTLLLPGNGTNGAQNNTFLDSSSNNFSITRNGNTTQGTFTPFSQTGWSNYFDGSSRLDFPTTTTYQLGSSNFTYETWVYLTRSLIDEPLIFWNGNTSGYAALHVRASNSGSGWSLWVSENSSGWRIQQDGLGTSALNRWYHIAVVRNGINVRLYVDGSDVSGGGYSLSSAGASLATTYTLNQLAAYNNNSLRMAGYLSNTRIVIGAALYTSNFTPSTSPLTTTSQGATAAQTEILTCQSNRFIDNSDNNAAITIVGNPSIQAFEPFAPDTAYSTTAVSGSAFFRGSSDNLRVVQSVTNFFSGLGNWEMEAWVYPITFNGPQYSCPILSFGTATDDLLLRAMPTTANAAQINLFAISSGGTTMLGTSGTSSGTAVLNLNAWSHLAMNRIGGVFNVWCNGTRVINITTQQANAIRTTGNTVYIAEANDGGGPAGAWVGYISNIKIVNGSASYGNVATITVPTSPATPSGSNLCCLFTNAGIIDVTAKNVLQTVGNTSISTVESKFGGGSIFFDGTGDYLTLGSTATKGSSIQVNAMNNANATIEMWVYTSNSSSSLKCLVDTRSAQNTNTGFGIYQIANNVVIYGAGVKGNAAGQLTGNTWVHLAVTRANTTNYVFINGTLYNTFSYGNTLTSSNVTIGSDVVGSNAFTGYIDDLRITNGVARYTANFTPTTTAFPVQ